ncbi:MAG TPA: hypothetical protein PKC42_03165 [Candidatus Nanoperiomorbaceae bacterium]|nr:hypothetical protein [Candidatus Nanoperiomorbaceae bacterium]
MSALPLPELLTGEGKADINVKLDLRSKCISSQKPLPISCVNACSNRVHLTWGGVGDLLVEEGSQITVIPIPYADEDALRLFILGAGLGVLLHQRGLLVLHASSVGIDNRGMGFIGHKGWGKSTTTATLHQRGHALISDELLVVRFNDQGQPWVIPGSPQIRLWSDSLASTGGNPDSAVRVRSGIDKYNLYATNIAVTALPFHCLYLLDIGEALSIQSMPPSEAFFGIIPHLYVCRFGTRFLQSTNITCAFQKLNLLLRKIKVKRLMRQWNLNQLPDVARRIEQDILQDQQLV